MMVDLREPLLADVVVLDLVNTLPRKQTKEQLTVPAPWPTQPASLEA